MPSCLMDRFQREYELCQPSDDTSFSDDSQRPVGYFCTYSPVELITACGYRPVRILGGRGKTEQCYNYLPEFVCPYMKRAFERAVSGFYKGFAAIVQSYTCDAVCGCQAVWENSFSQIPVYGVSLPYNDNPDARSFFEIELRQLIRRLGKHYDDELEKALDRSLELYRQIREKIRTLVAPGGAARLSLTAAQRWHVIQAGFVMDPVQYLSRLDLLIEETDTPPPEDTQAIPVAVSGSEIGHPDILAAIEKRGAKIVWDDHCTGIRAADPVDGTGTDPLARLVDRYMRRFPCAARSRAEDRWTRWEPALRERRVSGVIFILQKFCTPHLSDIPCMREQLRKKGIPSLVLEMDEGWEVSGQVQTRLEGFMEILRAG